nr:unnamed protein product [Callosobruchus analis]
MDHKSPVVSFEDFPNICRTCLNRGTLKPLRNLEYLSLYQVLIDSKDLQDDGLPYQMCGVCVGKLEDIHTFATVCRNNEDYLRRILSERRSVQCQNASMQIENEEEPGPPSPRNTDEDETSLTNEECMLEDISNTTKKPSHSRKAQPSNCEICQTSFKQKGHC